MRHEATGTGLESVIARDGRGDNFRDGEVRNIVELVMTLLVKINDVGNPRVRVFDKSGLTISVRLSDSKTQFFALFEIQFAQHILGRPDSPKPRKIAKATGKIDRIAEGCKLYSGA